MNRRKSFFFALNTAFFTHFWPLIIVCRKYEIWIHDTFRLLNFNHIDKKAFWQNKYSWMQLNDVFSSCTPKCTIHQQTLQRFLFPLWAEIWSCYLASCITEESLWQLQGRSCYWSAVIREAAFSEASHCLCWLDCLSDTSLCKCLISEDGFL